MVVDLLNGCRTTLQALSTHVHCPFHCAPEKAGQQHDERSEVGDGVLLDVRYCRCGYSRRAKNLNWRGDSALPQIKMCQVKAQIELQLVVARLHVTAQLVERLVVL